MTRQHLCKTSIYAQSSQRKVTMGIPFIGRISTRGGQSFTGHLVDLLGLRILGVKGNELAPYRASFHPIQGCSFPLGTTKCFSQK